MRHRGTSNRQARRNAIAQRAAEYTMLADASGAQICKCGAIRDEHDIASDFTQPCERTGCKSFDEALDPGHTPPTIQQLARTLTPDQWRDYLNSTTPEERENQ